jgi:hypothetical protein
LPVTLKYLFCDNNIFFIFPKLPLSLRLISYYNNDYIIYNKLYITHDNHENYKNDKISYINYTNLILYKFKFIFYLIKYKHNFHQWLWKSREKKIMIEMHPDNIINLFYNEIYENY